MTESGPSSSPRRVAVPVLVKDGKPCSSSDSLDADQSGAVPLIMYSVEYCPSKKVVTSNVWLLLYSFYNNNYGLLSLIILNNNMKHEMEIILFIPVKYLCLCNESNNHN